MLCLFGEERALALAKAQVDSHGPVNCWMIGTCDSGTQELFLHKRRDIKGEHRYKYVLKD